jgi:hypothetical protein
MQQLQLSLHNLCSVHIHWGVFAYSLFEFWMGKNSFRANSGIELLWHITLLIWDKIKNVANLNKNP